MNQFRITHEPILAFLFHLSWLIHLRAGTKAAVYFLSILTWLMPPLMAQTCRDASVEISVEVEENPLSITLKWLSNAEATQYTVFRKTPAATVWGFALETLSGETTSFTDTNVEAGMLYDYRLIRTAPTFTGYGYVRSGIGVAATEDRGILILVIDDSIADTLRMEIDRLTDDLEGDGWKVVRQRVARDAAVTEVRGGIIEAWLADPVQTKAVFLLGHVPVPYSGSLNPDGHPDHFGAWPADVYYGDMDGIWTDATVNTTEATGDRNDNVPGDGKFDQTLLPSNVDLQVGRVDFADMPAFALPEEELLRNYLDKDHAFRHKHFSPVARAVVDDNFGYFGGEAFAASAWKNFAPLVGYLNVEAGDYFATTFDSSYLWSYGCGGGSYTSASGIGSTSNFATANLQSVFTMLFGSYFGDWDTQNNFLRAPLAQGRTLTNAWSGRPHWMFHPMAMGETIGYCTWLSQNNVNTYFSNYGGRFVHPALMGDPSLRQDIVAPVSNVSVVRHGLGLDISWQSSPDNVLGHYIYMKKENESAYTRIATLTGTSPTIYHYDNCLLEEGTHSFMVRAYTLQQTPSGSYYNLSQGIKDTFYFQRIEPVQAHADWTIEGNEVMFTNLSLYADSFLWIFGDGTFSTETHPVHSFQDGYFYGFLIVSDFCTSDTFYFEINIFTGTNVAGDSPQVMVSPNPSNGKFYLIGTSPIDHTADVQLFSPAGTRVFSSENIRVGDELDLTHLPVGLYFLQVVLDGRRSVHSVVIHRE